MESTWNDWDHQKYRDQNFTYPVSNGILSTIQWEGFREGIDDVRYLTTLSNRINLLKSRGKNVSDLESFINGIDPTGDLDLIHNETINKILSTY